jgi:tetratricopeptide (TPR) repeat protein
MPKLLVLLTAIALLQITPGYRAQQLNAEGIRLMQQDRFAEAESQFRQAVQADPSNLEAAANLGVAIFKQGRFAESIPFFQQAVAAHPQQASLHNDLAQAYVRVQRPHDAAAEMARACDLEPRNPDYRRFLGDMLSAAHDRPAAEKQLRLAVKLAPDSAENWLSLAKLLTLQDRHDEAVKAYLASLRLNSRQPDALRELGEIYSVAADYPKAEAAFHKALTLDPNNALLHADLGKVFMKAGAADPAQAKQAEAELRRAIKLDSNLAAAHRDLGLVLRDQGKFDEAVRELRAAAARMPEDSSLHYQLSRTLRRAGKPEEAAAEATLSETLGRKEKQGQQVLALANEGLSMVQQGHSREGLVKIKDALRMDPENLTAHFNDAVALRQIGRYDDSILQIEKVLQLEPDMPAAHYQLGCDYFQAGRYADAVNSFRRAAALIPGTAAVHNGLGVALTKSGDTASGIAELLLAQKLEPKTSLYKKNLQCVQNHSNSCKLVP